MWSPMSSLDTSMFLKDQGHLSKLGLQIIQDVKIDFQSTKQLLVQDGL
jgi:hypothetical protein